MSLTLEIECNKNQCNHFSSCISFIAAGSRRAAVSIVGKTPSESIHTALDIVLSIAPNASQEELDEYYNHYPYP